MNDHHCCLDRLDGFCRASKYLMVVVFVRKYAGRNEAYIDLAQHHSHDDSTVERRRHIATNILTTIPPTEHIFI